MSNVRDFAVGSVSVAPSPATSGTTLTLQTGEGLLMPAVPFKATAFPTGAIPTRSNAERILVTGLSGDTITFTRAQGETTAKSIATGWIIMNSIYMDDLFTSSMVMDELLAGTQDGTNKVFTTSQAFTVIDVRKNGLSLHKGVGYDYTITNTNTITFNTAPIVGDTLTATYITGAQVMYQGSNGYIAKEAPKETPTGALTVFTTQRAYIGGSLQIYVNGIMQDNYITETNPSAGTFTFDVAPSATDKITCAYQFASSFSANADTVDGIHASTTPTVNQLSPLVSGSVVQTITQGFTTMTTGATIIPRDDTIPQITEGDQYMSLAITPKATTNNLNIRVVFMFANSTVQVITGALFQDTNTNAIAATGSTAFLTGAPNTMVLEATIPAGTTSPTTIKFRAGTEGTGTLTFNGISGARLYGAISKSSITITETMP